MTLQVGGDSEEGFVTVETDEGSSRFGVGAGEEIPSWVPRHPNADEITGTFSSQSDDMMMGAFSYQVAGAVDEVVQFYEEELQSRGFEITMKHSSSSGGTKLESLSGENKDDGRKVSVTAVEEAGSTQVSLQYHQELSGK